MFTTLLIAPAASLLAALGFALWIGALGAAESSDALVDDGDRAYNRGDVVSAMQWYRQAAESGNARAQARLGYLLDKAEENEEAVLWYRKAAEQGNPAGQLSLAQMYWGGEGVARDPSQAMQWMKLSAAQDFLPAVTGLARLLEQGAQGVDADAAGALRNWRRAAELGDHGAMLRMATAYAKGELGLTIDAEQSRQWQARLKAATTDAKPKK